MSAMVRGSLPVDFRVLLPPYTVGRRNALGAPHVQHRRFTMCDSTEAHTRVTWHHTIAPGLPVCVCTETLAAGINLPARSVVLSTLVKGPRDKKKLIDPSSAQQIFGRAGRPQFDTEGHVFAMAHEDDVKIARWQEKYDSIPEESKDPKMMSAKKALLKKKPTRRNYICLLYTSPSPRD